MAPQFPFDPRLPVDQDRSWEQSVHAFIQRNARGTLFEAGRGELEGIVGAYEDTSGSDHLQGLLDHLLTLYNVGEWNAALVARMQGTGNAPVPAPAPTLPNTEDAMPPPPPVLVLVAPPAGQVTRPALAPAYPPLPTTASHVSAPMPSAVLPAPTPPTTATLPALWAPNTALPDRRDPRWRYRCDACGHSVRCRTDFQDHVKDGAGRVGFKVVAIDLHGAQQWHGADVAGNAYQGAMVGPGVPGRIPKPCERGVRAAERRKKQATRAKNAAAAKKKGDDKKGEDAEEE